MTLLESNETVYSCLLNTIRLTFSGTVSLSGEYFTSTEIANLMPSLDSPLI